jgi:hypothetical protein
VTKRGKDDTGIKQMVIQKDGSALFSSGPANVVIELDGSAKLVRRNDTLDRPPTSLFVTVDEADDFIRVLRTG